MHIFLLLLKSFVHVQVHVNFLPPFVSAAFPDPQLFPNHLNQIAPLLQSRSAAETLQFCPEALEGKTDEP